MIPLLVGATAQLAPSLITADRIESRYFSNLYSSYVVKDQKLKSKNHFDDLMIPGLSIAGGTSRGRYFQIRGIGERSAYEGMPNSSVSVIVDNIDYTGVGGILSLQGSKSFEVYKGPQNTLIGPSALAGMLLSQTKSAHEDQNQFILERSSFNSWNTGIEQSLDFGKMTTFFSLNYQKSDGYFNNSHLKRTDTNKRDELSIKSKTLFRDFTFVFHIFDFDNGYDVFNFNNSKITTSDKPGSDDQRTHGASLTHDYKGDNFLLKTLLSGHLSDTFYSYDEDWGYTDYDYNIKFSHEINTYSIEERLTTSLGRFYHQTGLYFKSFGQDSREEGFKNGALRKDLIATFHQKKYSLYHETEYTYSPTTSFFLGGRLENVNSHYQDNHLNTFSPDELLWGGRVGLQRKYNRMKYTLSFSRGYKTGGINIGSNITPERRIFSREILYTLSTKLQYQSDHWRLTSDLFYNYRKDIQVKTSYQDNPSDPSSFTFYTDNGTSGQSIGGEITATIEPLPWLKSQILQNYIISRLGNYHYGTRNLKGRSFSYAPEYDFHLKNTFILSQEFSFTIEHQYKDNFYFGNSHDQVAPKSLLTNIQFEWAQKNINVALWGKNIFNERTESRGFFFGNRPPDFNNEKYVQVGAPAQYGLRIRLSY